MSIADAIHFEPFEPRDVRGVAGLADALGWPSQEYVGFRIYPKNR